MQKKEIIPLLRLSWDDSIVISKYWHVFGANIKIPFNEQLVPGFQSNLFTPNEWELLNAYCEANKVRQRLLVDVYLRFLPALNAHKHPNCEKKLVGHISHQHLLNLIIHSAVMSEIADVYIPFIFNTSHFDTDAIDDDDDDVVSRNSCSFVHFFIGSHLFVNNSYKDLVSNFLLVTVLGQNFASLSNLNTAEITIDRFLLSQTLVVLHEQFKVTQFFRFLLDRIPKYSSESPCLSIDGIISIGLRYPVLFCPLAIFKRFYRRQVFGNRYSVDDDELHSNRDKCMETTAKRVLMDFLYASKLSESNDVPYLSTESVHEMESDDYDELTRDDVILLKNKLGYKIMRMLLIESKMKVEVWHDDLLPLNFVDNFHFLYDSGLGRYFKWNITTGDKTWLNVYSFSNTSGIPNDNKDDSFRIMSNSYFYHRKDQQEVEAYERSNDANLELGQDRSSFSYMDFKPAELVKPTKMKKKLKKTSRVAPESFLSELNE